MSYRPDPTPYPLPELPDSPHLPAEVPWDTGIAELSGLWLCLECCRGTTFYPLRLMAAKQGWNITLREIVPRLKCKHCGASPATVSLTDSASGRAAPSDTERRRVGLVP